jgi:hypothetical protein
VRRISLACAAVLCAAASFAAPVFADPKQPPWEQLSPQQKEILEPLKDEWNNYPDVQRRRALGIAERYPKLSPQEQDRVYTRLRLWNSLSPEDRDLARKNFQDLRQLPPGKREEAKKKWQDRHQLQD